MKTYYCEMSVMKTSYCEMLPFFVVVTAGMTITRVALVTGGTKGIGLGIARGCVAGELGTFASILPLRC